MSHFTQDFQANVHDRPFLTPSISPEKAAPSSRKLHPGWIWVTVCLVIAQLCMLMVVSVCVQLSPAITLDSALDKYEQLYNGNLAMLSATTPSGHWVQRSLQNNRSLPEEVLAAQEFTTNCIMTRLQEDGPYIFSMQVLKEHSVQLTKNSGVLVAFEMKGIPANLITDCRRLTVRGTLDEGSTASTTTMDIYAVRVGLFWYLIIFDDNTFYFPSEYDLLSKFW